MHGHTAHSPVLTHKLKFKAFRQGRFTLTEKTAVIPAKAGIQVVLTQLIALAARFPPSRE
jgi:hypothetical protein